MIIVDYLQKQDYNSIAIVVPRINHYDYYESMMIVYYLQKQAEQN